MFSGGSSAEKTSLLYFCIHPISPIGGLAGENSGFGIVGLRLKS